MLEWSEVDLAVRDAVRDFVDKEIRPHLDDLESGDMPPYPIIRKLFSTFGIDAMAKESLERVGAPTLLIVGERDPTVLDLNTDARERMRVPATIEIVARAGHLFEEEGALERVAELTGEWFLTHLTSPLSA